MIVDFEIQMPLSRLEDLSDEIFLHEIFPMFSSDELYQSFVDLNERINRILRSLRHLSCKKWNHQHLSCLFFAPSLAKLTIYCGHDGIQAYVGLRSLTLEYPSLKQLNIIRPDRFPLLEYLKLSKPLEDSLLLRLIFSNAFPRLKSCRFDQIRPSMSWTGSPKLRSLKFWLHGLWEAACVLRACPSLARLNITIYQHEGRQLTSPKRSVPCINNALRSLVIFAEFEVLMSLLPMFPNLERLTFRDMEIRRPGFEQERLGPLVKVLWSLPELSYLYCAIENCRYDVATAVHPLIKYVIHGRSNIKVIVSSDVISS